MPQRMPDDRLANTLAPQSLFRDNIFDDPVGGCTARHVGNDVQVACRLDIGIVVFKQKKMQALGPKDFVKNGAILAML